ncbi:MAG: hypothetical protein WCI21_06205, partial [Alphaproteobacteria bacterium]
MAVQRKPKATTGPSPTTPDPIEIAMEAEAKDTSPDSPARTLLVNQNKLVRWDIADRRMGVALKALTGIAGIAVAVALAAMVWTASRASNVVIEAFSVPPALAERGITGEALARQLNDDLAAISEAARSVEVQRGLSGDWGKSLSVEIPSTGISLSQLDQWLRDKLGHQSRVSGEVMASPDGTLTLAARSASQGLPPLKGAEADMASLIQRTAEAVYAREQPRSYPVYLETQGRWDDTIVWSRSRLTLPSARARAIGYHHLGNGLQFTQGDLPAMEPFQQAMATDPTLGTPYGNLAGIEESLGHPETAYHLWKQRLAKLAADRSIVDEARRQWVAGARSTLARMLGDWREARARAEENVGKVPLGSFSSTNTSALGIAQDDAAMHDIRQAQAGLDGYALPPGGSKAGATLNVRLSAQDWAGAITAADEVLANFDKLPDKGRERGGVPTAKARALAHLGRVADAQSLIGATKLDCQPCVSVRGEIAAMAGDTKTADHWFSEAVRMAPSLPQANTDWGRALLDRGETDKAIARFTAANRQGPHFADPISFWGEPVQEGFAKGDGNW